MGPDKALVSDDDLESGIQALLDGRPLQSVSAANAVWSGPVGPLLVIDAIGRASRIALFGTDASLDRSPFARWGPLEVRAEIGRGTSGTVYRAWDSRLAREVALKLLTPDVDPRDVLQEGRHLARLSHPHIVKVYGADTFDGSAGIWMELLEGDTLEGILARDGPFGPEETLLIGLDLASALSGVHAAGLLHRDIKGRNVVRERGGRIVLADLGAGRGLETAADRGFEAGTPMFMAPEVLAGAPATVQSDVYGLGILLYRLLTGAFPTAAADLDGLRSAHEAGHRIPLGEVRHDLPVGVVRVIERGCHANRTERYESAADFEAALSNAFEQALSERAAVAPPLVRSWMRWRPTVVAGVCAIAMALLATWGAWETSAGRSARRALGLTVPPRSVLYLAVNGGLAIVRGRSVSISPYNPTTATAIAVSSDLGVHTMATMPPWTIGGSFRLDGTPVSAPPVVNKDLCCFGDGTTDGQFNYAARTDSTLLEPIGSRALAPSGLYRFGRDWSNPQLHFELVPDGVYVGVGYSAASNTFWLTRNTDRGALIEQWSRSGQHLSTPVNVPAAVFRGLAVDPADDTLWVVRSVGTGVVRLENFNASGQHLGAIEFQQATEVAGFGGAEFAWVNRR
jgi:serine/threonine protein kinase